MIQRKQSLYLCLVFVAGVVLFFLDIALVNLNDTAHHTILLHFTSAESTLAGIATSSLQYFVVTINIIILLLALFTLLCFRIRPLQIKLCRMLIFTIVILIGGMFLLTYQIENKYDGSSVYYLYAMYVPLIMLILSYLAMKGIIDDENLVRSADRLR